MRWNWIGVAVLGVALTGAVAMAGGRGPGRGRHRWHGGERFEKGRGFGRGFGRGPGGRGHIDMREHFGRFKEELNLTEEQESKIKAVREKYRPEMIGAFKPLREKGRVLRTLARADELDEAAIRAAARDLADAMADGAILRGKMHKEVRGVLTGEQREKLKELRARVEKKVDQAIEEAEQE